MKSYFPNKNFIMRHVRFTPLTFRPLSKYLNNSEEDIVVFYLKLNSKNVHYCWFSINPRMIFFFREIINLQLENSGSHLSMIRVRSEGHCWESDTLFHRSLIYYVFQNIQTTDLWRLGCRLNKTGSPSIICRSTVSPI